MPFSYKNGPSIFQCIMQNFPAPFLWIFALVYIDDIVIFSLTLEDHISHLDQVFKAIQCQTLRIGLSAGGRILIQLRIFLQIWKETNSEDHESTIKILGGDYIIIPDFRPEN